VAADGVRAVVAILVSPRREHDNGECKFPDADQSRNQEFGIKGYVLTATVSPVVDSTGTVVQKEDQIA